MITCLYVEDRPDHAELGRQYLKGVGFEEVLLASDESEAESILTERGRDIDLLVVDMELSYDRFGGYRVLRRAHGLVSPYCLFIVYTAHGYALETEEIVEAVNGRFVSFISKGDIEKFKESARSVVDRASQRRHLEGAGEIAVVVPKSKILYEDIERYIGPSLLPVLIIGPTGTGKEDVASKIHKQSGLPEKNFRPINCAAFSKDLIMSELFGYVKGAFTGADFHHLGLILEASGLEQDSTQRLLGADDRLLIEKAFERFAGDIFYELGEKELRKKINDLKEIESRLRKLTNVTTSIDYLSWIKRCGNKWKLNSARQVIDFPEAEGGTLFLDEIADLHYEAQGTLLRFLDGNGIRPVGYSGPPLRPHKVRVVVATNKIKILQDPTRFRQDLFWRLAQGWIVERPPLSERIPEALTAARSRALNTKQERYGGNKFDLDQTAVDFLTEQLNAKKFSSEDSPLQSGNFRNLLGLIDRACWIALADHPEKLIITEIELQKAQSVLQILEVKPSHDTSAGEVKDKKRNEGSISWRATSKSHLLKIEDKEIHFRGNSRFVVDLLIKKIGEDVSGSDIVGVFRSKSSTKDKDQQILADLNHDISKKLHGTPLRLEAIAGPRGKTTGLRLTSRLSVIIES